MIATTKPNPYKALEQSKRLRLAALGILVMSMLLFAAALTAGSRPMCLDPNTQTPIDCHLLTK